MSEHPTTPSDPAGATLAALDRLAQSRERLRSALADPNEARRGSRTDNRTDNSAGGSSSHASDGRSSHGAQRRPSADPLWARWWGPLAATPAVKLLLNVARLWWARQPARVVLILASDAAELVLQPVARRHPVRLVLGAAAVGALLAGLRPWRWLGRSAVTRSVLLGLIPQLISQLRDWRDPRDPRGSGLG